MMSTLSFWEELLLDYKHFLHNYGMHYNGLVVFR